MRSKTVGPEALMEPYSTVLAGRRCCCLGAAVAGAEGRGLRNCMVGCAGSARRPRQPGESRSFPLDMTKKSAIVKIVDVNAAPDQPPSTPDNVAFGDVWRPMPGDPSPASVPPLVNPPAAVPLSPRSTLRLPHFRL